MRRTVIALVLVVSLAGCSAIAPTTSSPTEESPNNSSAENVSQNTSIENTPPATAKDAARLEQNLSKFVTADVRAIGGDLSVLWKTNSTATLPEASTPFGEMNRSERELSQIQFIYLETYRSGSLNGSLTLTAIDGDGQRVGVWYVREKWVQQYVAGEMDLREFDEKFRESKMTPSKMTDTGGTSGNSSER